MRYRSTTQPLSWAYLVFKSLFEFSVALYVLLILQVVLAIMIWLLWQACLPRILSGPPELRRQAFLMVKLRYMRTTSLDAERLTPISRFLRHQP